MAVRYVMHKSGRRIAVETVLPDAKQSEARDS